MHQRHDSPLVWHRAHHPAGRAIGRGIGDWESHFVFCSIFVAATNFSLACIMGDKSVLCWGPEDSGSVLTLDEQLEAVDDTDDEMEAGIRL